MFTGKTKNLGVMGWPIAHSFSPALHNAALAAAGLDYAYIALPVGATFSLLGIVANYLDPRRMELETAQ